MKTDDASHLRTVAGIDLFGKLLRFTLSGIFTTALYFLLTVIVASLIGIDPVVASGLAYLICVVVSYFLQSRFTFQVRRDTSIQIAKFLTVSFVGLAVSMFVMKWAVDVQGLPSWFGALIVAGVIPIANFAILSIWVFVKR